MTHILIVFKLQVHNKRGLVCDNNNIIHSHSIWFLKKERKKWQFYYTQYHIQSPYTDAYQQNLLKCSGAGNKANGEIYRCGEMTMSFESKTMLLFFLERERNAIKAVQVQEYVSGEGGGHVVQSSTDEAQMRQRMNETNETVHSHTQIPGCSSACVWMNEWIEPRCLCIAHVCTFCDSINWLKRNMELKQRTSSKTERNVWLSNNMLRCSTLSHSYCLTFTCEYTHAERGGRGRATQNRQFETMQWLDGRCSTKKSLKKRKSTPITHTQKKMD